MSMIRVNQSDLRHWRAVAENCPDRGMADIVLALIREIEELVDEIRRLRQELT
jgi:hypothetical protein